MSSRNWLLLLLSIVLGLLSTFQSRVTEWYWAGDEFMVGELAKSGFAAMAFYAVAYFIWIRKEK